MASRRVVIEFTVKVIADIEEGTEVQEFCDELDFNLTDNTGKALINDVEILDHEVKD